MKSPCAPVLDPFPVIPAQAGIQGFQALALGPRVRRDDDFGGDCTVFTQPRWIADLPQSRGERLGRGDSSRSGFDPPPGC